MKALIFLGLLLATTLSGQRAANRVKIRQMIKVETGKLHQQEALERRLMQLRIRHSLGLPLSSLVYTQLTAEERNTARTGGERILQQYRSEVAQLASEEQRLSARVDERSFAAGPSKIQPTVSRTPRDDSTLPLEQRPSAPLGETMGPIDLSPASGTKREMPEEPQVTSRPTLAVDPAPVHGSVIRVRGSTDRSAIGRNMVRHATKLLMQADRSGEVQARSLRAKAKVALEDARRELLLAIPEWDARTKTLDTTGFEVPSAEEVTIDPSDGQAVRIQKNERAMARAQTLARREAVLGSLLYLGKCEEQFAALAKSSEQEQHYNAAYTYYAEIVAADKPPGKEPGIWALAALAAQSVSDWQNKNGGWKVTKINRIARDGTGTAGRGK